MKTWLEKKGTISLQLCTIAVMLVIEKYAHVRSWHSDSRLSKLFSVHHFNCIFIVGDDVFNLFHLNVNIHIFGYCSHFDFKFNFCDCFTWARSGKEEEANKSSEYWIFHFFFFFLCLHQYGKSCCFIEQTTKRFSIQIETNEN